ncbi:ABC-type dipeptide transport system periplasmic component-like protein [Staphylococcus aureus]|nr:ABC-type dipeptide transport system periplasmic component-like protein [Staphylococcus aureus]
MAQLNSKIASLKLFASYAIATYILVILTSALNLFKGYVADTFYIAETLLIVLTIILIIILTTEQTWKHHDLWRRIVEVLLLLMTLTGNVFTLLMFVSIRRYQRTSQIHSYNGWESFIRKTTRHRIAIIGLLILVYMLTLSIVSQFTFDTTLATKNQFNALLHGPSLAYPFGTDDFGRDLFTRVVVGTKLTFSISIISVVIAVIFGVLLGTIAGYFNHIDNLIMRILDVVFAIPSLLLAVAIIASFGASIPNLIIALSIGNIPSFARTMRASVLEIKRMEYVDAARITGENTWNIIWRYILPNAIAPMIVRFSLNIGVVVLTTSSLSFLGQASYENDMNIVKDQLENAGFNVKMNIQPDYGSYRTQRQAGNYDIQIDDWMTVFGDPNYAMTALFSSTGSNSLLKDKHVDQLLNKASTQNEADVKQTYKQIEDEVVFDKGYMAPLYGSKKNLVYDNKVLDKNSVGLPNSRALIWQQFDYNNSRERDTRPLVMTQQDGEIPTLDPIRSIAPSVYSINMNMYTRLLLLDENDHLTTKGSLSHDYAVNKDNKAFYFLLRDDDYFAKVVNGQARNTGERVSAEDVKFSLDRARDKKSVPNNNTYNMHKHINDIKILKDEDIDQLRKEKDKDDKSIYDKLIKAYNVKSLTTDGQKVNNKDGIYQIVKITTDQSMPREVNYLTHSSAGILSKKFVNQVNQEYPKGYGDSSTIPANSDGKNALYASGAYIMTQKNAYQATFQRNPGFNETEKGSYGPAKIKNITLKFNGDPNNALSELRNHSIDMLADVNQKHFDLIKSDKNLSIIRKNGRKSVFLMLNIKKGIFKTHPNLRQAVVNAIDQDQFIKFYRGDKFKIASPITPLVDTGNEQRQDLEKVEKAINQ